MGPFINSSLDQIYVNIETLEFTEVVPIGFPLLTDLIAKVVIRALGQAAAILQEVVTCACQTFVYIRSEARVTTDVTGIAGGTTLEEVTCGK